MNNLSNLTEKTEFPRINFRSFSAYTKEIKEKEDLSWDIITLMSDLEDDELNTLFSEICQVHPEEDTFRDEIKNNFTFDQLKELLFSIKCYSLSLGLYLSFENLSDFKNWLGINHSLQILSNKALEKKENFKKLFNHLEEKCISKDVILNDLQLSKFDKISKIIIYNIKKLLLTDSLFEKFDISLDLGFDTSLEKTSFFTEFKRDFEEMKDHEKFKWRLFVTAAQLSIEEGEGINVLARGLKGTENCPLFELIKKIDSYILREKDRRNLARTFFQHQNEKKKKGSR